MLRAALLALALVAGATPVLMTFAAANEPAEVTPASTGLTYTQLSFDDSMLPGETGWFAYPFTVDQPAYVRIEMDTYEWATSGFTMAHGIVAVEGRESWPFMGFGGYTQPALIEATVEGQEFVRCCDDLTTSWSSGSGAGSAPILLAPGEVLWVGLAAYEWTEGHDAWFTLSAQAILTQGEPRTGTRVEAVDLYSEAVRDGTRLRALNHDIQLATGAAERVWTAEHFGLMSVSAFVWDEGDGRVTIEVPGLEPVTTMIGEDGVYAVAHRAGEFRVALDSLDGPTLPSYDWLSATAFFADIDVPGDVAFIYPEPAV